MWNIGTFANPWYPIVWEHDLPTYYMNTYEHQVRPRTDTEYHHWIKSDSATKFRRFRNQISTIPQPKSDTLPQPKKGASATKKKDSATKKGRFRNQNKTIPQPKTDDSATKIRAIRKPKSASLCNQDLCFYTLHGIVSKCHTQHGIVFRCSGCSCGPSSTYVLSHSTWHRLQMRWGGVGWDNNVLAAAFLPLTHLRPHSTWHRLQMLDLCARRSKMFEQISQVRHACV